VITAAKQIARRVYGRLSKIRPNVKKKKCRKKRKKKEVMPRSRSGNFLIADRVLPRRCTLEAACSLTFKKLPKFSRAVVILG